MIFADVAFKISLHRTFQYEIPEPLQGIVHKGILVQAPFGSRLASGCVVDVSRELKCNTAKPLRRILSPGFYITEELFDLASWIAEYYFCTLGEALSCVSFLGFHHCESRMEKRVRPSRAIVTGGLPVDLPRRQREVLEYLVVNAGSLEEEALSWNSLRENLAIPSLSEAVKALDQKGLIVISERDVAREDEYDKAGHPFRRPDLYEEQSAALDAIRESQTAGRYETFLLWGVTGSGKTEVYLRALEETLARGDQGIVLVPEIALTPQTVERFRGRFGNIVGVYHSHLTLGQKFDMWKGIHEGRIQCLVGARSAVFAPFPRLRLIVVDEEHESTYKQGDTPRYHARDVAIMRASRVGATVILGSATPSLESFHNARTGKYKLLRLPRRALNLPLPSVRLVDMVEETAAHMSSGMFSSSLLDSIRERLSAREQVILFLNRRGFSVIVMCSACRKIIQCPQCDVSMTYHKAGDRMLCHYCGATISVPDKCPECDHAPLTRLGAGTQRLEEELEREFPEARIMRLDSDSMSSRCGFLDMWKAITAGEVDILLGTQILAKGFDLAPVTLVGVISADHSLFLPDFRSAERTFCLLVQVAGRAGRGERPGEVIIQTYLPRHKSIADALSQDYEIFAERELRNRKALRYPPYYRLVSILISGKENSVATERARRLAQILRGCRDILGLKSGTWVLGPAPSAISRLNGLYRHRILIRGVKYGEIRRLLDAGLAKFHEHQLKGSLRLVVDVDPQDLL
ncbi:MAG TPA: primosomal protein N' [Candidatus Sumerlaeota bacterium]|nr:primosomal protein N' [Candidatus Sumerlaeota bacterium]